MAVVSALSLANLTQAQNATFDWSEVTVGTAWWNGYGYTETDNGVTLVAGGRAASIDDGTTARALKAAYVQDADPGTFDVQVGGVSVAYTVTSIDIGANVGDETYQGTPLVQGMLGGVEQWSISPETGVGLQTYTAATTGDMALAIDQIVWSGPWADPGGNVWGNEIDNLSVSVVPEPSTFALIGLGLAGFLAARRRR